MWTVIAGGLPWACGLPWRAWKPAVLYSCPQMLKYRKCKAWDLIAGPRPDIWRPFVPDPSSTRPSQNKTLFRKCWKLEHEDDAARVHWDGNNEAEDEYFRDDVVNTACAPGGAGRASCTVKGAAIFGAVFISLVGLGALHVLAINLVPILCLPTVSDSR